MKKQIFIIAFLAAFSGSLFAQVSQGDVQLIQKYFGVEKASLLKQYMAFTPKQDSVFWPIYNKYEAQRQDLGRQRIALIDDYLKNVQNITEEKATQLVEKSNNLEISFKAALKKCFTELSKKIGPVKAAQFYQFENYINNVISLKIQENIPFIGDLEQKHAVMTKKK